MKTLISPNMKKMNTRMKTEKISNFSNSKEIERQLALCLEECAYILRLRNFIQKIHSKNPYCVISQKSRVHGENPSTCDVSWKICIEFANLILKIHSKNQYCVSNHENRGHSENPTTCGVCGKFAGSNHFSKGTCEITETWLSAGNGMNEVQKQHQSQ